MDDVEEVIDFGPYGFGPVRTLKEYENIREYRSKKGQFNNIP